MEYSRDENGNVIITDGNKRYLFMNFKDYVGSNHRQWYEEGPDCFRLQRYDEPGKLSIIGTVYEDGGYLQLLIIDEQDNRRSIIFKGGLLSNDEIFTQGEQEKTFTSVNEYRYELMPVVKDYFKTDHEFVAEDGEKFEGFIAQNSIVNDFFKASDELLPSAVEYAQNEQQTL